MIRALPSLHAAFLGRILGALESDDRFDALLAGGSMVHGGFDEQSDIDLVLVAGSEAHAQVMERRREFAESLGALLSAFTGEHVGEPRLLICLYGPGLLHVDLKFVAAAELGQLVERPGVLWARDEAAIAGVLDRAVIEWPNRPAEWFEERIWTWLHYGATKYRRGELFEALGMLAFLREQVLGPMLHRRARRQQRGVRRIERDGDATQALRAVVAGHDAASIGVALQHAVRLYLELREDEPPANPTPGMPGLLAPLLAE
jgi:hypothetical protein